MACGWQKSKRKISQRENASGTGEEPTAVYRTAGKVPALAHEASSKVVHPGLYLTNL
jgi:hypothetical protein